MCNTDGMTYTVRTVGGCEDGRYCTPGISNTHIGICIAYSWGKGLPRSMLNTMFRTEGR